jgi:hypothetical protein
LSRTTRTRSTARTAECGDYTSVYGNHVIVIEYTKAPFKKACKNYGSKLTVVLRDVLVTAPGSKT